MGDLLGSSRMAGGRGRVRLISKGIETAPAVRHAHPLTHGPNSPTLTYIIGALCATTLEGNKVAPWLKAIAFGLVEEKLYFVQSPASSPAASPLQESSSSSSDVSMHFDSEDLPVRDQEAAHTSAPVASNVSTAALEDLKSYFSQRIDESTYELGSKVNAVEFNVRGDLVKQQAWLRQTFQSACDILERQSKQMNDLKKGLMAPVGTILQDLFDIKKNQRAHEAKLNALDGQVAALRNDQLEFQNRISADLLSLSTQFADIVEFIRGGDAKKGESGSSSRPPPVRVERRPLPTPQSPRDVAGGSNAMRIPTFPRTTGTFEERFIRGGDAKKGESGSSSRPPPVRVERRPLPTPQSPRDVAGGSSAERIPTFPRTTGTFAERVEQVRRHLLESGLVISVEEAAERIRQADFQESDRFQRERERARKEKRNGMVVSTISGTAVEISESVFAEAFGLPTEGMTDLSEVPRDLLSNAQKLFSASEKEVSISCLKREVKMPFRLLSDILAKSLFVKVGSFDAVTRDRFLLMTSITFDVKVNWGNLLFGVLKEMVTPDSRPAKGYAIQICVLLKNIPGLELGDSKAFPAPRILNEKTVHRIVSVNENVGVEEVGDAPRAKTTPVKRTVSKKRPASVDADVAPVIKKKRTTKSKPVAAKKLLLEEPIAAVPSTEEQIPVAGVATEEHIPVKEIATEDADATIRQVLTQLDLVFETQDDV
ncbi:hypothetical protein F511_24339 [Dorcoceras hygrometricum]|uniref:Uncharacterized protein n=1 Tax=Dorcoceras hygrometricum TaxID=472368 RepID=A0A2Z7D403_9LAMI|nr:hypothetical protein F511_24339 [Dorcoceras hygrometricum]